MALNDVKKSEAAVQYGRVKGRRAINQFGPEIQTSNKAYDGHECSAYGIGTKFWGDEGYLEAPMTRERTSKHHHHFNKRHYR